MNKNRNYNLHDGKTGSAITVRIAPGASKNEIGEILGDGTIKVNLAAASSEAQVNQTLVQFLATVLQIAPAAIEIVAGHGGKDKLVTIIGLDSEMVNQRVMKNLAPKK